MDLRLPQDVQDFAASARGALAEPDYARARRALDGDRAARIATIDRLRSLGLDDLDVGTRFEDALAAGSLARAAGRAAVPAPTPALLTARAAGREGIVQAVDPAADPVLVNHADLFDARDVAVVSLGGALAPASAVDPLRVPPALAPWASRVTAGAPSSGRPAWWALYEVFAAFETLGAMEAAAEMTRQHAAARVQFGRPLNRFQAVQHRYADILVACAGLTELCQYTLYWIFRDPEAAITDALALRMHHIEAARIAFRNAHQIHAAIGFCDEHPLSLLSRVVQFHQYVPFDAGRANAELLERLDSFRALYAPSPRPRVPELLRTLDTTMSYEFAPEEDQLRSQVRALIDEHVPDFPGISVDEAWPFEATLKFCRVLAENGLLTVSWPRAYGGREASLWAQTVVREEMWAHNEPRGPQYFGLNWLGPAIMRFGTPEQKGFHLPRISRGEALWCQGFSEPGAGSDLASLSLKAEPAEGGYRLTGQKIWTSNADIAEWCIVAARTSSGERKQHGITIFLVPMDRDGIEVRPIPSMVGPHVLNEVFFDGAFAADEEVLGEVDRGWEVVTAALAFERTGVARYARSSRILAHLATGLADRWGERPPALRARFAESLVRTRVAQILNYRVVASYEGGTLPRREAAVARIATTMLDQEVAQLAMDMLGAPGLMDFREPGAPLGGEMEHHWRYNQASTVTAGTLEVQKMLLAREM